MAAHMEYAAQLRVLAMKGILRVCGSPFYADDNLLFEDVYLLVERQRPFWVRYFMEYPGPSEGGSAYHHSINTISLKGLFRLFCRRDVAIANDGDVHTRVGFHLAYVRPVGRAGVHLCSRATMNGESLGAAVLQTLGQVHYERCAVGQKELVFVPMYIAPRLNAIYLGKPTRYSAESGIEIERDRITDYLMTEITEMARALPEHTVVPYRNIRKKLYPKNTDRKDYR